MGKENSHLTIHPEAIGEGLAVPIWLLSLDGEEQAYIHDTPYLDIDCEHCSDSDLNGQGTNLLIRITDPSQLDEQGEPLKNRLAYAINADYEWH